MQTFGGLQYRTHNRNSAVLDGNVTLSKKNQSLKVLLASTVWLLVPRRNTSPGANFKHMEPSSSSLVLALLGLKVDNAITGASRSNSGDTARDLMIYKVRRRDSLIGLKRLTKSVHHLRIEDSEPPPQEPVHKHQCLGFSQLASF